MQDAKVRTAVVDDEAKLANAEAQWKACNEDPSLGAYIHLRHKFLAHLAEPKSDVPKPIYKEVFDIARNTARCFGDLANGTGIVGLEIDTQIPTQKESAVAFWKPWLRRIAPSAIRTESNRVASQKDLCRFVQSH
ncbi:MAG: hypothetical protein WAK55_06630 [Xanthobacteraceae bacterium]